MIIAADILTATELALVGVLRNAGDDGELRYQYRIAETFPDEIDAYLRKVGNLRTPACWAVFLEMANAEDNSDDTGLFGRARFAVVVATQNQREEEQTRHGDGTTPGSYELAVDAARILTRNWLAPLDLVNPVMVEGFRPVARTKEMTRQGLAMMALTVNLGLPLGLLQDPDAAPFTTLHAHWDIPEHGNVQLPLPASNPDAEDEMELPQ